MSLSSVRIRCDLTSYLVANRPSFPDFSHFLSQIQSAVRGGISCVQLRDPLSDEATLLEMIPRVQQVLCQVPLFLNTAHNLELVHKVGAAGVYLEKGEDHKQMRALLGPRIMIGVPVKRWEEVLACEGCSAIDYLSVKVNASKQTCPDNHHLWGLEGLARVTAYTKHRVVAIGGIDVESAALICEKLRPEGDGIAMAGGVMREKDPAAAVIQLKQVYAQVTQGLPCAVR